MFSQPLSIKMPTGLVHLWGLETMHGWGALYRWEALRLPGHGLRWCTNGTMSFSWQAFSESVFFPLWHCCSKSGWTATESYFFCMRRSLCCAQSGKSLHLEVFYGSIYSMVDMLRFLVIRWLNRHIIGNVPEESPEVGPLNRVEDSEQRPVWIALLFSAECARKRLIEAKIHFQTIAIESWASYFHLY